MRLPSLRHIALGLGALVYAGLFAEGFLRVMAPQVLMPRYITDTDYGIRGNIPNAVYRQLTPEADVEMRINAQGMRADRDIAEAKPPATCRIALMGDSYFMGYEVDYEHTLGALLETRFAEEGYGVEVLNFAVSGFSTEEMLRVFEARARDYAPDIIVYQFNGGDFGDNMRPGLYRMDADGVPRPTEASYLPGVDVRNFLMQFSAYRWLISSSHAYSAIREWTGQTIKRVWTWIAGLGASAPPAAPAAPATPAPSSTTTGTAPLKPGQRRFEQELDRFFPEHQTRYTSALIELSRIRAEEEGLAWFLLEVPDPVFVHWYTNRGKLTLSDATWDRVVSPMEVFRTWKDGDPLLYRTKGHFHLSPLGHDLTTRALMDAIRTEPRLAGCKA